MFDDSRWLNDFFPLIREHKILHRPCLVSALRIGGDDKNLGLTKTVERTRRRIRTSERGGSSSSGRSFGTSCFTPLFFQSMGRANVIVHFSPRHKDWSLLYSSGSSLHFSSRRHIVFFSDSVAESLSSLVRSEVP